MINVGNVLMTRGIAGRIKERPSFREFVIRCVQRHMSEDWGDLCKEDAEMNDEAVRLEREGKETDRIFSSYNYEGGKIWVITEYDRSYTTVMLPEEY